MIKTFSVPYPYMIQTLDRYYGVKARPQKDGGKDSDETCISYSAIIRKKTEVIHFDCHVLGLPAHGRFIKLY